MLDDPEISITGLMEKMPGPDFPTAGIINGVQGIYAAYKTGRGRVPMRARVEIEDLEARARKRSSSPSCLTR